MELYKECFKDEAHFIQIMNLLGSKSHPGLEEKDKKEVPN